MGMGKKILLLNIIVSERGVIMICTGVLIIVIGALFLLQNLHIITFSVDIWNIIWPVVLIAAGLNIMFAHKKGIKSCCDSSKDVEKK